MSKNNYRKLLFAALGAALIVAIIIAAAILSKPHGGGSQTASSQPAQSQERQPAARDGGSEKASPQPLPENIRTEIAQSDPEWLSWAERLRGVYTELPEAAQQEVINKGEYAFHLADLPAPQAQVVRDCLEQYEGFRRWGGWHLVKNPPNYPEVTFRFMQGSGFFSFMIQTDGNSMSPVIGGWSKGKTEK